MSSTRRAHHSDALCRWIPTRAGMSNLSLTEQAYMTTSNHNSGSQKKVWFITGAGRGMGADFARAVLAAGHALVATGRDPGRLAELLGPSDDLLAVKLDVTRREDADAAVKATVERFGRIDVLVNNAAI